MAFTEPTFTTRETTGALSVIFTDSADWTGSVVKADVTGASLVISMPDPTTLLPDSSNQNTVDIFARGYPLTTNITLLPTDFLQVDDDTTIPDGVYYYELTVTTAGSEYTYSYYGTNYKLAECCADALSNNRGCGCNDECFTQKQMRLMLMRLDFWVINLNQLYCQTPEDMALALLDAQSICANSGHCSNCG